MDWIGNFEIVGYVDVHVSVLVHRRWGRTKTRRLRIATPFWERGFLAKRDYFLNCKILLMIRGCMKSNVESFRGGRDSDGCSQARELENGRVGVKALDSAINVWRIESIS